MRPVRSLTAPDVVVRAVQYGPTECDRPPARVGSCKVHGLQAVNRQLEQLTASHWHRYRLYASRNRTDPAWHDPDLVPLPREASATRNALDSRTAHQFCDYSLSQLSQQSMLHAIHCRASSQRLKGLPRGCCRQAPTESRALTEHIQPTTAVLVIARPAICFAAPMS